MSMFSLKDATKKLALKLLDSNEKEIEQHRKTVAKINALEPRMQALSDEQMLEYSNKLRQRAQSGESLDDLLVEAFALCREAARRAIGMRPFDVQVIGGIVLHQGKIAEMATGEGKTLAATMPVYLNALLGRGVHVVTVNEFLARRDAGWMGPVYHKLGLTVGVIGNDLSLIYDPGYTDESHVDWRLQHLRPVTRKQVYLCDVTYGTNNEFGFDYLRDNMVQDLSECVQRDLYYAIVDEVDSVLIDEARTPLIISAPSQESTEKYMQFARIAAMLKPDIDYTTDEKTKTVALTEEGIAKVEKMAKIKNLYDLAHVEEAHLINKALQAKCFYQRDVDYVVKDGEVIIVDEFTGRLMPGRRWSDGLHQAIEAKERVRIQQEMRTLATITFQNYFRLYEKLAGMTGTAYTEAEEFHKIYGLDVVVIPTNKPMIREDYPDLIYKTEESKFKAVVDEIEEMHKKGRPVLVGTVSIEKSEKLSRMLEKRGLPHQVLNAKNHEKEALIIAQAGQRGAITIATNMAGRGTDIVLGEGVAELGGLHVIGTERHEARRIDNQLRGRAGRQGDPGSSRFFVSLEDELMRVFGPQADRIAKIMERFDVEPIEHKWISKSIEAAQRKVEGFHFDARKSVVEYDDVMNEQRAVIYGERRKILEGVDTRRNILDMLRDIVDKYVDLYCTGKNPEAWDIEGLINHMHEYFWFDPSAVKQVKYESREQLADLLYDLGVKAYEEREKQLPPEVMRIAERWILLNTIDNKWVDHLTRMEYLREGIGLRAYGQVDPLVEFKREAFDAFNELLDNIKEDVVKLIFRVQVVIETPAHVEPTLVPLDGKGDQKANGKTNKNVALPAAGVAAGSFGKVGRNDPCPCGSGLKYKKCHGR